VVYVAAMAYRVAPEGIKSSVSGALTTHDLQTPLHAVDETGATACGAAASHAINQYPFESAPQEHRCAACDEALKQ